jgi:hypothetical protein
MRAAKVSVKNSAKLLYGLAIWGCSIAGANALATDLLPAPGLLRTVLEVVIGVGVMLWPWVLISDADPEPKGGSASA